MTETEYINIVRNMFSRIIGCAFDSYNFYHSGVDELTYEAGFYMELVDAGFIVHRQEEFPIYYKGKPSPVHRRMDLVCSDEHLGNVVIELKALRFVGDEQRRQLWSYMKLMNIRFGLLVNFGEKAVFSEPWMLNDRGVCVRL